MVLGYFSPAWALIVMLVAWAAAATPLFKAADTPPIPSAKRDVTIDGLRGFLALLVFVQHASLYHTFILGQGWRLLGTTLFLNSGKVGVALFFMITGYLFWGQMLRARGQPSWRKLYVGRAFRILPLYWFAAAIVIAGAAFKTHFHLQVSEMALLKSLIMWLGGGVFDKVPINGYAWTWLIVAGVTWTLRYEWGFYALLIVLGQLCRSRRLGLIFPMVAAFAGLIMLTVNTKQSTSLASSVTCLALFGLGGSVAAIRQIRSRLGVPDALASVIVSSSILTSLLAFKTANAPGSIVLLGLAFLLIADGCSLFGVLRSRAARRLGDVSYGIYLLQGAVLVLAFGIHPVQRFALTSPLAHWTIVCVATIILVVLATATHVLVERPGIDLGRRILRGRARAAAAAPAATRPEVVV